MDDESDWKFKVSLGKVPVVHLSVAMDFTQWHLALRRLVTGYSMADALLYSVPDNQLAAVKVLLQATADRTQKVKRERPYIFYFVVSIVNFNGDYDITSHHLNWLQNPDVRGPV